MSGNDLEIKIVCARMSERYRNSNWRMRGTFEAIYKKVLENSVI